MQLDQIGNKIGIIGGGQLALMLGAAASRMGYQPIVLAEDSFAPAARVFPNSVFGSSSDPEVLALFFSQVKLVIFENEFVDCNLLKAASQNSDVRFFPSLHVIARFQNKIEQKKLLKELGIPTADYMVLGAESKLRFHDALKRFGGTCVLKWAKMGYDGKGVLPISHSPESLAKAEAFYKEAEKRGIPVFAEKKISFVRELAVVAAYSTTGECKAYPLVVSEQVHGICSSVYGPATAFGITPEIQRRAQGYAQKMAQAGDLRGVFALEFFETSSGDLLVNEIAPRVHNSGHYTQNAGLTDQFENHIRAILGLPLGDVVPRGGFAMLNLLGPEISGIENSAAVIPGVGPRTFLHWYHKKELRSWRKLGHLNGRVDSIQDIQDLRQEMKRVHDEWVRHLESGKR